MYNLIFKLSDKFAWGDMLTQIAIPAIQQIINNCAFVISDTYGISMTYLLKEDSELHEAFCKDILNIPADKLFGWLIIDSIEACCNLEAIHDFINLRGEIEREMRKGKSHNEAITEWYK